MSDEETVTGGEGTDVELGFDDRKLLGLGEDEAMDKLPDAPAETPASETETPAEEEPTETPAEEAETPAEPEATPEPAKEEEPKPTPPAKPEKPADTTDWSAKKNEAATAYREAEAELARVHGEMDKLDDDDLIPAKLNKAERAAQQKMAKAEREYRIADEEIAAAAQRSVDRYWNDFAAKNPDIGASKGKELAATIYSELEKEFPNASPDALSIAATKEFNVRLKAVRDGMKGAAAKKGGTVPAPKPKTTPGGAKIAPTGGARPAPAKAKSVAEQLQEKFGDADKVLL